MYSSGALGRCIEVEAYTMGKGQKARPGRRHTTCCGSCLLRLYPSENARVYVMTSALSAGLFSKLVVFRVG